MELAKIVSHEEWLAARTALLAKEKEFTRRRDQLSAERRALPRVKVEMDWVRRHDEYDKAVDARSCCAE